MSAECGDCGRDIEYPAGSWPLGECSYCRLYAEKERLETLVGLAVSYIPAARYDAYRERAKMLGVDAPSVVAVPEREQ